MLDWPFSIRSRDWIALVAAIAIGPFYILNFVRFSAEMIGDAPFFYLLFCATAVPLVAVIAARWKLVTWQVAVASMTTALIVNNFQQWYTSWAHVARVAYVFWAMALMLSSPVPIYFLLRPLAVRRQIICGIVIGGVAMAMILGIELAAA